MQALEDLDYLAALDNDGNLSEFGIIMSEFPLEPQLSKSLLASCEFECVDEMLTIAAMVTGTPGSALSALCHLPSPGSSQIYPQKQIVVILILLISSKLIIWLFKS